MLKISLEALAFFMDLLIYFFFFFIFYFAIRVNLLFVMTGSVDKPLVVSDFNQGDIFSEKYASSEARKYIPLSIRMRPKNLTDIVGQRNILGEKCLLPKIIKFGNFGSIILYGPPGCGKTTFAEVIAKETKSTFVKINAILSNVAELREILTNARRTEHTVLFIDEIHRFNKSQQDLLLYDVENGNVSLVGATTHNPGFYIIPPLLSRSHLFKLEPISIESMICVLRKAANNHEDGLGSCECKVADDVFSAIASMANGDLRWALNALETLVMSMPCGSIVSKPDLDCFAQERLLRYDSGEDEHYDTISAYIKSMRGCDPDAAIYWLAKMLSGGEDPRFIARRLVIFASEDVGLADSRALPLAIACFEACEKIGMPECRINLAHATVFMATAQKSNSAYLAMCGASDSIQKDGAQQVPVWLRDSHGIANNRAGNSKNYLYSHSFDKNVSGQRYMETFEQFYFPKCSGAESAIADRLANIKSIKENATNANEIV